MNWYSYCAGNPVIYYDPSGNNVENEKSYDEMTQSERESVMVSVADEVRGRYDAKTIAPAAYSYAMDMFYRFYATNDESVQAECYLQLTTFRDYDYKTTNGVNPSVDEGIQYMPSRPTSGKISEEEHYFRNTLNVEYSWEEFQAIRERVPERFKWHEENLNAYHQHHMVN
ncbi:MAG: hypothetical protein LUC97_01800 [Clostridiales bacterium]|nr:hypothetical protein [Clostridiales bacterium]